MEIMTRKKEHKLKKLSILLVLIMLFTIAITGCSKEKEDEKTEEIEEIIEDRAIKFDRSDVKKQVVYDDEDVKVTIWKSISVITCLPAAAFLWIVSCS